MIEIKDVTKTFGSTKVLENINSTINEGSVYGLIGANGAGKSTILRIIAGVYKADKGAVYVDGEPVYENPRAKAKIHYVADDLYFLPGANIQRMEKMYSSLFPSFSKERLYELCQLIGLDTKKSIGTFSKGMKRQAAIMLALSTGAKYIFFDETFDGLDPVMRNTVKKLIMQEVMENGTTIILSSHSLRELEDTCDQLSLLHKGGIVFERDIEDLRCDMFKLQVAFNDEYGKELFEGFEVLSFQKHGSVSTVIIRGDRQAVEEMISGHSPVLMETLPLTLEEVFIYEMEALGYSFETETGGQK